MSDCDVLVIGAGPAGIAAAVTAASGGARVALCDMQAAPGGQIWRGEWSHRRDAVAARSMASLERSGVALHLGHRLIAVEDRQARFDDGQNGCTLRFNRAIVATGARELLLPFPGWTLPGVFGAGGLQALAKNGWPLRDKRVVVAGSGPLLLAVAASLRERGATLLSIAEQATTRSLVSFGPALLCEPAKIAQSLRYAAALRGVPYRRATHVVRAEGDEHLRAVILRRGDREWRIEADYLAAGYGLVPNTEVATAFGCVLRDGSVFVDADQRTSTDGVFAVGESTGIGGVDQAIAQGEIAGHAVVDRVEQALASRTRLRRAQRFAAALRRHFALRDVVLRAATDESLLCRCEDVPVGAVRACASQREAKLHTRLGMGHCQGRVCGAAASALFGWDANPPRLPLAPVPIGAMAFSSSSQNTDISP